MLPEQYKFQPGDTVVVVTERPTFRGDPLSGSGLEIGATRQIMRQRAGDLGSERHYELDGCRKWIEESSLELAVSEEELDAEMRRLLGVDGG